ncbi:MAG: hypothetical protein Q9225_004334 [Loekoesia sp. 1 TL-2023]
MDLFRIIIDYRGAEGVSADKLAELSKGDKRLIAQGPSYYKSTHYTCPTDYKNTPFQRAFNTDLGFYEYLSTQPDASRNFHTYMSALQERSPQWVDWFPVQERIIDGFDPANGNDVLLIDIGGGKGHYVKAFREKFPHAPGRLVLQELHRPDEAEGVGEGIDFVECSFFDVQPIKGSLMLTVGEGARAYYFHFVFTDWGDEKALEILNNTVQAMKPGYSKLIINDVILPNRGCHWQHAALDIIMMSTFSGFHRSEDDFKRLLGQAGLEIEKFWYPPGIGDGVVEAVMKG